MTICSLQNLVMRKHKFAVINERLRAGGKLLAVHNDFNVAECRGNVLCAVRGGNGACAERQEKNEMQLKDGDMVFLVTDGVTDALDGEERTSAWLREKLAERPMANPQEAAEYILHAAKKERRDGRTDDMTVVAGRFWKKRHVCSPVC